MARISSGAGWSDAILAAAASTAEMIARSAARTARPDRLEVEFGLRLAASAQIELGGVTGEAAPRAMLSYESKGNGGGTPEAAPPGESAG